MKHYENAETYFEKAAYMCPVRFIPLYELMNLYQLKGDPHNTGVMAKRIVNKPIKINSPRVKQIKTEAKKYIITYTDQEHSEI